MAIVTTELDRLEQSLLQCKPPGKINVLGLLTMEDVIEQMIQEDVFDESDRVRAHLHWGAGQGDRVERVRSGKIHRRNSKRAREKVYEKVASATRSLHQSVRSCPCVHAYTASHSRRRCSASHRHQLALVPWHQEPGEVLVLVQGLGPQHRGVPCAVPQHSPPLARHRLASASPTATCSHVQRTARTPPRKWISRTSAWRARGATSRVNKTQRISLFETVCIGLRAPTLGQTTLSPLFRR